MSIVKKTFRIPDMHCSACVMKLEGLEDDLPGVHKAQASYQKQSLVVDFDDETITEEEIRKAVEELEYSVEDW